jgi:hypothetical protein
MIQMDGLKKDGLGHPFLCGDFVIEKYHQKMAYCCHTGFVYA